MECKKASASRMTTYEECPLRYYSRYELGIRGSSTIAIDSGQLGHGALEVYYSPKEQITADEAFNRSQSENSCADKEEFEEAKKMFFDYVNGHPREQYMTIGAEVQLDFSLESGASFLGYIDRLDLVDSETIRIVDYKTGRFVPSYSELELAHQTNLYPLWIYRNPDFKSINHIVFSGQSLYTADNDIYLFSDCGAFSLFYAVFDFRGYFLKFVFCLFYQFVPMCQNKHFLARIGKYLSHVIKDYSFAYASWQNIQ
jgi:hypothetical protein